MAEPTNSEIAEALDELGDLSELDGAVIHRIVAYRNAAKTVLALADDGAIPATLKLRAKFPAGLLELTHLPGLGPRRARRLYEELGIDSLEALEDAATAHRIRELKGFGPKAEESLLAAVVVARADAAAGENGG